MFRYFLIAFILFSAFFASAQTTDADTVKKSDETVLLIPFRPDLYVNEMTREMVKASGMDDKQILNFFRSELDIALAAELIKVCKVNTLLGSFTATSAEDVELLYEKVNYFLQEAIDLDAEKKEKKIPVLSKFEKKQSNKPEKKEAVIQKGELVSHRENPRDKFLNIKYSEKRLLPQIAQKYSADYLLFINQIEFTPDYSKPEKVTSGLYERKLKVHFSIFNKKGEFVFGSFAAVLFPNEMVKPNEIVKTTYAEAVAKIVALVPITLPESEEEEKK